MIRTALHRVFHACPPRYPEEVANSKAYDTAVFLAPPETVPYHGLVYEESSDGQATTMKTCFQTTPTAGPNGPDIPESALRNNRVFMYVDGIHVPIGTAQTDVKQLFETTGDPLLTHVDQPTIGIQEGVGLTYVNDALRIAKDFEIMKAYQAGTVLPGQAEAAYINDPAVKSVHDEIQQSLQAGREVTLAGHSGGGCDSALALTILAHEGFQDAIAQHVRLLEIAPAAAPEDYLLAGIKPENLYYTGSHQDFVYQLFHNFVPPEQQTPQVTANIASALMTLKQPDVRQYHTAYYIFANNLMADGQNRIQQFLDGGPGGNYGF